MEILAATGTNLFVGTAKAPRQVVRVRLRGDAPKDARKPATVRVEGRRVRSETPVAIGPLGAGEEAQLEIGTVVDAAVAPGASLPATVVVSDGSRSARRRFELVVAEPGWRLFMVSHFHYDPVWWNTQAAYTETWGSVIRYRTPFQEPGLALVKAHLETARRDPLYKFVLAELDYLKPYWDAYPEDRAYIARLLAEGRLEFMGGTYNEPNTNLTSAESTVRNAIYGVGYQRDVLGGAPATAWQLDAFGHDPAFPGIMADAGITSSSWARGPFHEWGPHWVRGPSRLPFAELAAGERPRMQFPTEFDWIAPSGRALLTSFMADHYSAGWWMDAATSLEEAEAEVHRLFTELSAVATTKNVLLPVGTDYSPPNKWLTAIHRDWAKRYVWPKFLAAVPAEFFAAVREERAATGRGFSPQTRDMNPVYTGKDVSFIDTKQAQRVAENTLMAAEKFATFATLLGARYPSDAIDKAWRQLLFGAHHDGITGSESDQVYLDLIGGWREANELAGAVRDSAIDSIGARIDTTGDGVAVTVFNPLSWARSDIARVVVELPDGAPGLALRDGSGAPVPFAVEAVERRDDGRIGRAAIAFLARDVPATGYRTWRAVADTTPLEELAWRTLDAASIENETWRLAVDPERGGGIASLVYKRTGKELVRPGRVANELLACREYPNHPLFAEGPWHLTPDGRLTSTAEAPAEVTVEASPIGRRIRIEAPFEACRRRQEIVLWDGVERIELSTSVDGYDGHDLLFRVRFPVAVEGGTPIAEVGHAVVGRPFGMPNVDVADVPFTLDHPAYNWFGLGATARISLVEGSAADAAERASAAFGIAEVVGTDDPTHDEAIRRLVVALVRQGVTATLSRADGSRYGVLHIDSNLPDVRIAVGRPRDNRFVAAVLEAAGPAWRSELDRQIKARGWARLWIPAVGDPARRDPIPDLRGPRDLPVLVVAGRNADATVAAIGELAADLADGVVRIDQPASLDGLSSGVEDYTVAVLNHGLPGFNVEPDGSLYLSLMRSCSGWPSGVWIDPPRRATPDGANFQFQHWSHTFRYALAGGAGDWRSAGLVRAGHELNQPPIACVLPPHAGDLPPAASFLAVEPASVVATVVKPAGNPRARMSLAREDPAAGLVIRLYESTGRPADARIRCFWPLAGAATVNLTEESSSPARWTDGVVEVGLEPFGVATVRANPAVDNTLRRAAGELGPMAEPAQPVFAAYWLHNKGAAPLGYQPVTVQIKPSRLRGSGPFTLPVVVASERTDGPADGTVKLVLPTGWRASPASRDYRLAPGAHLEFDAAIEPPPAAAAGRYFVAARLTDDAGQAHEDVVTIDLGPAGDDGAGSDPRIGSRSLADAIERALRGVVDDGRSDRPTARPSERSMAPGADELEVGAELEVEVLTPGLSIAAGESSELRVRIRNRAASEIRGEAQVLSPHETWPIIGPWTQGFAVDGGATTEIAFRVDVPFNFPGGTWWALVKVMAYGRLWYTESVPLEIGVAGAVPVSIATAGR